MISNIRLEVLINKNINLSGNSGVIIIFIVITINFQVAKYNDNNLVCSFCQQSVKCLVKKKENSLFYKQDPSQQIKK